MIIILKNNFLRCSLAFFIILISFFNYFLFVNLMVKAAASQETTSKSRTTSPRKRQKKTDSDTTQSENKFADVAGMEEEKLLLQRFIDFLQNPEKYQNAGAKMPKGVLLAGPPGTGKTLLAKALAGEAGAPFYAFSGTDFLQKIHGDGAKKVRELFEKIKNHDKGSIIFIDEIDSFAIVRNDFSQKEKEITTELLNQMDGIKSKDNKNPVIVIAATNRVEALDYALLRPGRFDYVVNVLLPDLKARKAILELCAKGKKISNMDFNLEQLAQETQGLSGAQLKAILNEASMLQAEKNKDNDSQEISYDTIIQAKDNVLLGIINSSKTYNPQEKGIVATHAAAKIIISQVQTTHFLNSVSLIPRSLDKILTLFAKEQNSNILSKDTLIQEITVLLAGKAAEEVICKTTIDKACSDFSEALSKAQEITRFFGYNSISTKDKEDLQRDILKKCFSDAKVLVKLNEPLIKELSQKLQEKNITPMQQIEEFLQSKQIKDMKEIKIQTSESAKGFNKTTIWHFICIFLLVFAFLLSIILIFKTIYWLFAIPKNYFIFKNKIIIPFLVVVSLIVSILLFSFDFYQHLPFINSKPHITVSDLLNKIDNYEAKEITYVARNSWLEGFCYYIKLIDKNGASFCCKLKPISQNNLEQKIVSLKCKDFIFQEEKYFDWINLLIKIILFCLPLCFCFMVALTLNGLENNSQTNKTLKNVIHKKAKQFSILF